MKKALLYFSIISFTIICDVTLNKNNFAMTLAPTEEKEDIQKKAEEPADQLIIEKNSDGVTIIRHKPALDKKPADGMEQNTKEPQ